jgi:hypothetical protein
MNDVIADAYSAHAPSTEPVLPESGFELQARAMEPRPARREAEASMRMSFMAPALSNALARGIFRRFVR